MGRLAEGRPPWEPAATEGTRARDAPAPIPTYTPASASRRKAFPPGPEVPPLPGLGGVQTGPRGAQVAGGSRRGLRGGAGTQRVQGSLGRTAQAALPCVVPWRGAVGLPEAGPSSDAPAPGDEASQRCARLPSPVERRQRQEQAVITPQGSTASLHANLYHQLQIAQSTTQTKALGSDGAENSTPPARPREASGARGQVPRKEREQRAVAVLPGQWARDPG